MSFTKRGATLLAAVAMSVGILTTIPTAATATPAQCPGPANFFGIDPDGELFVQQHNAPQTGSPDWTEKSYIGTGWLEDKYALAAPGGNIYLINYETGGMYQYRWNGRAWDFFGRSLYATVGSGFDQYVPNGDGSRITIDQQGRIYAVDAAGNLRLYVRSTSPTGGTWTPDTVNGKVIGTGWDTFDRVIATGDGILYGVTDTGELLRYKYDFTHNSWATTERTIGEGWNHYDNIYSAGGETLYALSQDTGNLYWYSYDADTGTWQNNAQPRLADTGWDTPARVLVDPGACHS
ncbi:tachylectin-related carbohydrate-binding protein [Actinokineospora diospyrosa]|uniref:Tachylectin n=1 Tax=Actinokineospora diospyrosa TaxID=103728 RepID=A0ABT1IGA7_9PSEU|nr:tachylectin-related carbohydrate-binding protein [Actinokineospora diospyrosa]MCP2271667.1 Tachylectin [Actinokineospora diospyrosa]